MGPWNEGCISPCEAVLYHGALKSRGGIDMLELNPLITRIKDMQSRADTLRGYL